MPTRPWWTWLPVCDTPGRGLCSQGPREEVPALPAAQAWVEPPEGACGAAAGRLEGVSQEQTDSSENIPTEIISISCVKTWLSSEIISDMIQLIKACMVLTVSLEEIILHKKNKKSL